MRVPECSADTPSVMPIVTVAPPRNCGVANTAPLAFARSERIRIVQNQNNALDEPIVDYGVGVLAQPPRRPPQMTWAFKWSDRCKELLPGLQDIIRNEVVEQVIPLPTLSVFDFKSQLLSHIATTHQALSSFNQVFNGLCFSQGPEQCKDV